MLEFMGIAPGPAKTTEKPATAERPDFESLYNEAMQQVRQQRAQLEDAARIFQAMETIRGAEADLAHAKLDAERAVAKIDKAELDLARYGDTAEALREMVAPF